MNVQDFLINRKIPFDALSHEPTYTANHLAHELHTPQHTVAKTVLLAVDEEFMLAVLPATHRVDVSRVADFFAAYYVDLASEDECGQRFADCELGAVPPFGSKYGMRTIVDRSLLDDEQIVFEGNSHVEAIRMRCDDFIALEDPVVGDFTHGD